MYHPRFKGAHYEMGRKMGHILKRENIGFRDTLDAFQRHFGKESGKVLRQYFPDAASEIRGITDVTGYDYELFTAWMMCMGCCLALDDPSKNCLEVRGCTAFSFVHNGNVFYARTNDLPPFLKKTSKSIYYRPDDKPSFILNTSSFINGEEGINQHGLVAAMTFVVPRLEEIKPGLSSVFLVRYILEHCTTVEEGIDALYSLPIASSCNILLTDRSGSMVVVECNPFTMKVRYPEQSSRGEDFVVTVNHFSSKEMWQYDASNRNIYYSEARYTTAYNALHAVAYDDGYEHAKAILRGRHGFMCQYEDSLNFETIWSSVFHITDSRVYRTEGNPFHVSFIEDKRLVYR